MPFKMDSEPDPDDFRFIIDDGDESEGVEPPGPNLDIVDESEGVELGDGEDGLDLTDGDEDFGDEDGC